MKMNRRWNRKVCVSIVPSFIFSWHLVVQEQDPGNAASGAPIIRADIEEEAARGFDPLKSLLKSIATVYADRDVSTQLPTSNPAPTNHSVGIRRSREKDRRTRLPCSLDGRAF